MRDLFTNDRRPGGWKTKIGRFLLDLDARIDTGLYHARRWGRELYERFTVFMDRFHVSGWRRWYLVEPISEGLTIGAGGLVLMLALAIPAFRETNDGEDWLKASQLAVSFLDRYGNEIGSRGIRHNDSIPLDEFPDHLIKAVLATEDRRFFEHFGVDLPGTMRAMLANARAGGVVQGGSSISQQLAKNLFLTNERTIERKVKEAFLAIWLEVRLSKNDILKLYLDRAYLGGGTFGVDAAAQYYFNKSARDVTMAESAMLAGLFKAPSKFAPHINLPAARARANVVLDNLVEAGFMTEGQVFGARRNPSSVIDRRDERAPNYYLDWAFDEMKKLAATLPRTQDRVFVARLAVDLNLQRQAELAVENSLRQHGRDYRARQAAAVLMEHDGAVRAMVGGRDYGESQFNRATDALRQPGSSFKPYVYAAALQSKGFKPTSVVVDSPVCIGNWCPKNYSGGYSGSMTLTMALTRSINVIPVKLSIALGNGNPKKGRAVIRDVARKAGLRTPLIDTPSMPIGANEVTVLDHTGGFGMFVNGGKSITPHAILEVRTASGDLVWRFDRDGKKPVQVVDPQVALDINMMLHSAAEQGTGRRAILPGIPIAGKTGTTNAYRDAWFVGYTGNYLGGVWFGNDDYQVTNRMTGGSLPAMTWQQIMVHAHEGIELRPLPGINQRGAPGPARPAVADARRGPVDPAGRQYVLTRRGAEILTRLERSMDDVTRALAARETPEGRADVTNLPAAAPQGAFASASDRQPAGAIRGN